MERKAGVVTLVTNCFWISMVEGFCVNCAATSTPMWRAGPSGPKSLCNACGLRWKKGALKLGEYDGKNSACSSDATTRRETATKATRNGIPSTRVATGRVRKKVRTNTSLENRVPKKIYVDIDRYECIFAGLMVVNKFKDQMV
uniref:GATA-type domain-containing protein n=1 Tax=Rhodosorus marinus TaxID=101924 RepID=A0A6T6KZZ3_9RHOD|mmetsp:Transcript_16500/g.23849  ORF Transcript_16500/g.23849 Transcript_16500/m.23849 type:complete len:143 (+) Transcript_16500:72-500(+)